MAYKYQEKITETLRQVLPSDMFFPRLPFDAAEIKELVEEHQPFPSCHHFHDHDCRVPQLLKSINVFKQTWRLYFLSHLIPLLLFKRKALRRYPARTLLKLILGWLRSMAFICNYGIFCRRAWCAILSNGSSPNLPAFAFWSVLATMGILFEAPSRRSEICMYVVPRWLEGLPTFLGKRGLLPSLPFASNIFFALAIALITGVYFSDDGAIKSHMRWLTASIIGRRLDAKDHETRERLHSDSLAKGKEEREE